jgi:hypothetical protein
MVPVVPASSRATISTHGFCKEIIVGGTAEDMVFRDEDMYDMMPYSDG